MKFAALFLLLVSCISAKDWYVRPTAQGGHDGSSYTNAWGGLAKVVWGANGVKAGDNLYVCGTHNYITHFAYQKNAVGTDGTTASPITIRGDYAGDPGVIIGARHMLPASLVNRGDGTYSIPDTNSCLAAWQGDPTIASKLLSIADTTATCVATPGSIYYWKASNGAFHTIFHPYPNMPNDFYYNWVGGGLWVNGHHDIIITNLPMFGGGSTGVICLTKSGPTAKNITIDNCRLRYGYYAGIFADASGSLNICIKNLKISEVMAGTYAVGGVHDGWKIQNVEVTGGDDADNLLSPFVTADRQALGGQNMRNLLIEFCYVHNWPGDGVIDYVYSGSMMDNVIIRYNKFENLNDPQQLFYHYGIAKHGTTFDQFENNTKGWEIYGNQFINLGGNLLMSVSAGCAIRLKGGAADDGNQTQVHDNIVFDCNSSIFDAAVSNGVGFTGRNNVSLYPKVGGYHVFIQNFNSTSSLILEHNSYVPDGALWVWKSTRQANFVAWKNSSGCDLQ